MNFSENSLSTPHNELSIFYSTDKLTMKIKKIKSLKKILISLLFSLVYFIAAIYFINQIPLENIAISLNTGYSHLIIGIVIIFLCLLLNILIFRRRIRKQNPRSVPYADKYISDLGEWIYLPFAFFSLIEALSEFFKYPRFNNFIFAFAFLFVGTGFYLLIYMFWTSTIEISIKKIDDALDIYAEETVPLINGAPKWMKSKLFLFHKSVPNMHLAVLPYSFKKKYPSLQLSDRRLDKYSWLSLEDIEKISDEKNRLSCFFISNKSGNI